MALSSQLKIVAYYAALPLWYLLRVILSVLLVLASPLIYLGHLIVRILSNIVDLLARFESLYIFVGVALLFGATAGISLSFILSKTPPLVHFRIPDMPSIARLLFGSDVDQHEKAPEFIASQHPTSEDLDSYVDFAPTAASSSLSASGASLKGPRLQVVYGRNSLIMSNTILEEDSSSDYS